MSLQGWMKSLLVLGGTGFIGKGLCKKAIEKGYKVFSVSRRGTPSTLNQPWMEKVEWVQGDALNPTSYSQILPNVSAVVHSIGILSENSIIQRLSTGNANFAYGGTFETFNRDSAINILKAAESYPNIKSFAYISADEGFPSFIVDKKYFSTKREAEAAVLNSKFNAHIFRPGYVYSEDRPISLTLQMFIRMGMFVAPFLDIPPPIRLDNLAEAVINSIDKEITGIFSSRNIEELNVNKQHP